MRWDGGNENSFNAETSFKQAARSRVDICKGFSPANQDAQDIQVPKIYKITKYYLILIFIMQLSPTPDRK